MTGKVLKMNNQKFDLAVIGGGPGGYTAAISGSKAGLRTVLIESGALGGTCLNRGCVPTKTLLHDAVQVSGIRNSPFLTGTVNVDPEGLRARKDQVVQGSRDWLASLLSGNNVTVIQGAASFNGPRNLEASTGEGEKLSLDCDNIIISTGAREEYPPGLAPDGRAVWDSDAAIAFNEIPDALAIVGGGARGAEFAQLYRALGVKTALLEKEGRIIPRLDKALCGRYRKALQEKGIKVLTGTEALSAKTGPDGRGVLEYQDKKGTATAQAERILLCLPRRPNLGSLNLASAGLSLDDGLLAAGPDQETGVKGVYVIGDAAGPPYWAHKAIAQALAVIEKITGSGAATAAGFRCIPSCIYGDPEVASAGLTEVEVKKSKVKYKMGEFHFIGNGRAGTMGKSQGLVRMLAEADTGKILGVHIIGPGAVEMISLAALAIENNVGLEGIQRTVFSHPTLAESFFEAGLGADSRAIHMLLEGAAN